MLDTYMNGLVSPQDDMYFLQQYDGYEKNKDDGNRLHFSYINEELRDLEKYLPVAQFQSMSDDFTRMVKLMLWVHNYLIPDGTVIPIAPFNCINIFEKTKTENIKSNCWMFAVALNEVFLSFGYKSRMIRCMPFDLRCNDCHCVVQAYVDQYKKWVVFDAAFGAYYADENRQPINLKEMRDILLRGDRIRTPLTLRKYSKEICNYWIKNSFRFESYAISKFNMESDTEDALIYSLLPIGYELTDKTIECNGRTIKVMHTHNECDFWRG